MEARRLWNNTFIMPNDSKTLSLELYTSKNTFQDKHDEAISEKQKSTAEAVPVCYVFSQTCLLKFCFFIILQFKSLSCQTVQIP